MIAACPNCKTKFRIARERLTPEGVRLRCTQCRSVFRVKAPDAPVAAGPAAEAPAVPEAPAPQPAAPQPAPAAARAEPGAPAPAPAKPEPDPERLVVVAHSDPELCKLTREALERWSLQSIGVHDGVEAILAIQRNLPRAVVLDAALPKMFGFQVCELVKRNESLRSTAVVLVGAIHDDTRYRRTPGDLYGADLYLEPPDLPDGLFEALQGLGLPVQGARPEAGRPRPTTHRGLGGIDPDAALEAAEREEEQAEVAAPRPAAAPEASGDPRIAEAERLARIIVSDVVLYNEDKFTAAVAAGNVAEAMEPDLAEGRSLFQARIDPEVAGSRDFLRDELLRVARARSQS